MSQSHVEKTAEDVFLQLFECVRFRATGRYPKMDDGQKNLVRSAWAGYVKGDPTETGIQLFLRLFEMHPRTKDKFDFARGTAAGQFQNNSRVIFHVTRVIKYLGMVVEHLDNLEDVVPILKQLGGRHGTHGYNIPAEYFPMVSIIPDSLINGIEGGIDTDCDDSITDIHVVDVDIVDDTTFESITMMENVPSVLECETLCPLLSSVLRSNVAGKLTRKESAIKHPNKEKKRRRRGVGHRKKEECSSRGNTGRIGRNAGCPERTAGCPERTAGDNEGQPDIYTTANEPQLIDGNCPTS